MPNYDWQDAIWDRWFNKNNLRGNVRAVVSAGKTRGGAKAIVKYIEFFGEVSQIWVLAPSKEILSQWQREELLQGRTNIQYMTYISALNKLIKDTKLDPYNIPDLIVCDESHTLKAPQTSRILNFGIPHILGLSGTPNGVEKAIGGEILSVDWEDANIAPTNIYLVQFNPTKTEIDKYNNKTKSIKKYQEDHPYSTMYNDQLLQLFYLQRRNICYGFESRFPIALDILKHSLTENKRVILFFARKKQVQTFSKILNGEGIEHAIHYAGCEHLDEFANKEKDVLLCVEMLSVGYSDPSIDDAIVVAPTTSILKNVQRTGRAIRPRDGKEAKVFFLLAENTSDEELINKKNQLFVKNKIQTLKYSDLYAPSGDNNVQSKN